MLIKHEQLTEQIIQAFYTVYHTLGYGFREKVYENALAMSARGDQVGDKRESSVVAAQPVILSEAKNLVPSETRLFAPLRVTASALQQIGS